MTEPLHHGFDALYPRSLREPRPRDHDDGKVERACGVDLGAGAVPPELRATIHSILRARIISSSASSVKVRARR